MNKQNGRRFGVKKTSNQKLHLKRTNHGYQYATSTIPIVLKRLKSTLENTAIVIASSSLGMSMMSIKTEWIEFVKGFILLLSIVMAKVMNTSNKIKNISEGA